MNTILYLIGASERWFQATNIGAYFAPVFRPMVTEQQRLVFVTLVPNRTSPADTLLRRLADERNRP